MNNLNDGKINIEHLAEIRNVYTNLVDYLKELLFKKGILDSPSYAELSRKLGFHYSWIKDKRCTMKEGHFPKKETFDDLYHRLSERHMKQLGKYWDAIQIKFNALYTISFSTNNKSLSEANSNQISIKREFFNSIKEIFKSFFPKDRIFDTDISRLFFKRARTLKDSHLKGDYKYRRLDLSTLFSFIYKMRMLTPANLIAKIRDIETIEERILQSIKVEVENFIKEFIFANPFDIKYIGDNYLTGTKHLKPEFDLTLKIWMELSLANNGPILLKIVRKMLKYESFGRLNRFGEVERGKVYSLKGLMNMLNELTKLLPCSSYSRIFEDVWKYIELRNLRFSIPGDYHPQWNNPNVVKFHVIFLILRDLGLDILNLEPIDPKSFEKTHGMDSFTYERHHIFINDKMSIDVNRLALVMHKNHNNLEGKTDLVLDLIQRRIELTLECPQYYKTNINKWQDRWEDYLERRCFLIENGIGNFIRKYFKDEQGNNYIIERFFKNIPKDNIERDIRTMMQEWITKNRLAPTLNTYILKRLFYGTPHLITSGFIQYKS